MKTKICSKCRKKMPATAAFFHRNKSAKDGLSYYCKKCSAGIHQAYYQKNREKCLKKRAEYRKQNPEKIKQWHKQQYKRYKERYGEDLKLRNSINRHGAGYIELFNGFFVEQGGICPGCGRHQSEFTKKLCLDHDHETGEYRGLLCSNCNRRVGSSKKDIQILKNLVKYLENFYSSKPV